MNERDALIPRSRRDPILDKIAAKFERNEINRDQLLQFLFWRRGAGQRHASYRDTAALVCIIFTIIIVYTLFGDFMFLHSDPLGHTLRYVPVGIRSSIHFFGRVFVVGDSSIRGMLPGSLFGEIYDWKQQQPAYTEPENWDFINSFRHRESPTQKVRSRESHIFRESFILGNSKNASAVAVEMYTNLMPSKSDILVLHFGEHASNKELYKQFITGIYEEVVRPFPGQSFWIEPFPQHYSTGIFVSSAVNNETDCVPMDKFRNLTQYWRVQMFKDTVKPTENIHIVPAYEQMAANWREHTGASKIVNGVPDCTHYTAKGYNPAVRALEEQLEHYTVVHHKNISRTK